MLIDEVEDILEENGFGYSGYSGCFDIIARKRDIFLLKVLSNIDSFQEEQGDSLKILSRNLPASTFLIGEHTRRECLQDDVMYERFGIPAITTGTFDKILNNEFPMIYRLRGGLFAEVNPEKLREGRKKAELTQEELARRVDSTKKSIYEHEKSRMLSSYETAKKIEKIIGNVTEPVNMRVPDAVKSAPESRFEQLVSADLRKLGFLTDFLHKAPFNIIAISDKVVFSCAEKEEKKIERNSAFLLEFTKISRKPVLAVTENRAELDIPNIEEKELREMKRSELLRILR